ncbi:hypothetical protein [Ferrimicrobium sp.]|uniref:hypothetical protein n=1 Tax=Ferrimicrobium sp. TaxID=2926050 RepID=UPI00263751F8|nr:hypothetical protein [Ferrimicrobium sp.]
MISLVSVVTAAALVDVAALAWGTSRAQLRIQRIAHITEITREWMDLQEAWQRVVLVGHGERHYYQHAHLHIREQYHENLLRAANDLNEEHLVAPYLAATRDVLMFCSRLTRLILQNDLSIEEGYTVLGSPFICRAHVVRNLSSHVDTRSELSEEISLQKHLQDLSLYHHGINRRTRLPIYLLWSGGAKQWNLPPADVLSVFAVKANILPDPIQWLAEEVGHLGVTRARRIVRTRKLTKQLQRSKLCGAERTQWSEPGTRWRDALQEEYPEVLSGV